MQKYYITIAGCKEIFESEGKNRVDALLKLRGITVWTEEEFEETKIEREAN